MKQGDRDWWTVGAGICVLVEKVKQGDKGELCVFRLHMSRHVCAHGKETLG